MKSELERQIIMLEEHLKHASSAERLKLHPKVQAMIDQFRHLGERAPSRLRQMDYILEDEAFDAKFDNMPV